MALTGTGSRLSAALSIQHSERLNSGPDGGLSCTLGAHRKEEMENHFPAPTRDGLLQTPKDFQFLLVTRLREPERERAPLTPGWTAAPLTKALLTFENPSEGPELPGAGSEG